MRNAELVLALLIAVAALVTIARRLGIAYPIFLVIGGVALGLVPGLPLIEHQEIRRTVIDAEREALLRLRAEGAIDDDILRSLERELDFDERRMDV